MAAKKKYADASYYETKLEKVMERFGATDCNYDWSRHAAWIEFRLNGQMYRFDHSVVKARQKGIDLTYGSDVFAQIVLTLEDLARMAERGIYEMQTWLEGMKFLPSPVAVPGYFVKLGFESIPANAEEVKTRYKTLAKKMHPDAGGNVKDFISLQENAEKAVYWFDKGERSKCIK